MEAHPAGVVAYLSAGIGSCVVEKMGDGLDRIGCGRRLFGGYCVERYEHFDIDCSGVIQEYADNLLYLSELIWREKG